MRAWSISLRCICHAHACQGLYDSLSIFNVYRALSINSKTMPSIFFQTYGQTNLSWRTLLLCSSPPPAVQAHAGAPAAAALAQPTLTPCLHGPGVPRRASGCPAGQAPGRDPHELSSSLRCTYRWTKVADEVITVLLSIVQFPPFTRFRSDLSRFRCVSFVAWRSTH
jgi:hypothetical protein